MTRATRIVFAVVVGMLLVAASVTAVNTDGDKSLTANFTSAIGVYPGAQVKVLGVQVGEVEEVVVEGTHVRVELTYDADHALPAGVHAVVVPPSLLGDRFIQLTPAYTGGPVLADSATLPSKRTSVPLEVDETIRSLDELARALGPRGANAHGALSRLVSATARSLKGNGARFNATMVELTDALTVLAEASPDIAGTITNLGSVTANLAKHDDRLRTLITTLSAVSTELNGQRGDVRDAVGKLDTALAELAGFLNRHRPAVAKTLRDLTRTTRTVAAHRKDLAELVDVAPLAVSNVLRIDVPQNYDPQHRERVHPDARTSAINARGNQLNDLDAQLGHAMTALCGQLPAEYQRQLGALCDALRSAGGDLGTVLTQAATGQPPDTLGELMVGGAR